MSFSKLYLCTLLFLVGVDSVAQQVDPCLAAVRLNEIVSDLELGIQHTDAFIESTLSESQAVDERSFMEMFDAASWGVLATWVGGTTGSTIAGLQALLATGSLTAAKAAAATAMTAAWAYALPAAGAAIAGQELIDQFLVRTLNNASERASTHRSVQEEALDKAQGKAEAKHDECVRSLGRPDDADAPQEAPVTGGMSDRGGGGICPSGLKPYVTRRDGVWVLVCA